MTPLRRINQAFALGALGWDYILGLNLRIAGGLNYAYSNGWSACLDAGE